MSLPRNRVMSDHCSKRYHWSVKWHSEPPFVWCLPIKQEILNVSQKAVTLHGCRPPFFVQIWLQQYCRCPFFHSAHYYFCNPICFWSWWCRRTTIPGKIFTGFAKFQGVVSVNDFRLPRRLQELLQALLCFLRSFRFARIWLNPFRAPPGSHRPVLEAHPGANTFPPVCGLTTTSFTDPSASRNTFSVSTITDGNARGGGRSTLPWLYIEPSPCGGVRPSGDPVDSDPGAVFEDDPHPRSDASRPLEPWVCHHTRELTVLSRVSCRPSHLNVDRFHQPCLLPWRAPYCHRHTAGLGRDRWGLSSPYHVAATYPFWAAQLSLLRDSLEVLPRRPDGTTAGC